MSDLTTRIRNEGIIPVVKLDDAKDAVPLAKALKAGGLGSAEVTFRTAAAEESIRAISKAEPDMLVGAGTVLSVAQAKTALAAGAKFIVCPGFDPAVVDFCLEQGTPIFPGTSSATEVSLAIARGLKVVKFFPAENSGGVTMLNALSGPFGNIKFMPTGGVNLENLGSYLKLKNVIACGGTWMVKPEMIAAGDWAGITDICRKATSAMHGFTFAHLGINADPATGNSIANTLAVFGFEPNKDSEKGVFAGTAFEVMKLPVRGAKGHIGIKTWNVDRAVAYVEKRGFRADMSTATYTGEAEKSPLKFVYLEPEVGGFAVHIVLA
jgi:2-dehydro-3-deoxyphosphogluconate aldolase/(4S)-4-hydroxy-2-oxoglutarate aldolase